MEAEEFTEADVLWPDSDTDTEGRDEPREPEADHQSSCRLKIRSRPIDIPAAPAGAGSRQRPPRKCKSGGQAAGAGKMVPPHVTVARRMKERVGFLVCTVEGRPAGSVVVVSAGSSMAKTVRKKN